MTLDRSFVELNRASTVRISKLVFRLNDDELQHPVGKHWTVAIALSHLAFWDRRVLFVLDKTIRDGKVYLPEIDIIVNDIALPLWGAIPSRQAANLCIQNARLLDSQLENFPSKLLEDIYSYNQRWVVRALHRNEHLDEVDAALKA